MSVGGIGKSSKLLNKSEERINVSLSTLFQPQPTLKRSEEDPIDPSISHIKLCHCQEFKSCQGHKDRLLRHGCSTSELTRNDFMTELLNSIISANGRKEGSGGKQT